MKSGLIGFLDNYAKVAKGIEIIARTRVLVGVPSAKTGRKADPGAKGGPISNSALAYIHEHGAPEANIPARPFMAPGIANAKEKITAGLKKAADMAAAGRPEAAERAFHAVGLAAQAAIRAKITSGPFVPLKPATLAARRRRGRTGTKPLIDTGALRNSITYVIKKI